MPPCRRRCLHRCPRDALPGLCISPKEPISCPKGASTVGNTPEGMRQSNMSPLKCQILDVIFQGNPKDSPKRMFTATDPCWMLAKERAQGSVWTSRDKQLVPLHSGNERHSTAKSSRHIPNILAAGGQLRGEPLHGPGKAESAHLPSRAPSKTDKDATRSISPQCPAAAIPQPPSLTSSSRACRLPWL